MTKYVVRNGPVVFYKEGFGGGGGGTNRCLRDLQFEKLRLLVWMTAYEIIPEGNDWRWLAASKL